MADETKTTLTPFEARAVEQGDVSWKEMEALNGLSRDGDTTWPWGFLVFVALVMLIPFVMVGLLLAAVFWMVGYG